MSFARSAQSGPTAKLETPLDPIGMEADLAAVLAQFPATASVQRVVPLTAHGGLSGARIWRVDTVAAVFALRQWPAEHPSPERLRFIHAVLDFAFLSGMPQLPVPLETRSGETFVSRQGRLWELAPWLPGAANFETEPSAAKIDAAIRALANFHVCALGFNGSAVFTPTTANVARFEETRLRSPSPGLVERARRFEELDRAQFASLRKAIADHPIGQPYDTLALEILPNLPIAAATVKPLLPPAAQMQLPLQPCLRDIWHGNVLFTGDEVTGIVDFGAMQVDSPALDVARLLGSMAGDDADSWRRGLTAYEEIRPLSPEERTSVRAADTSGIVLGCVNWLRWLYIERRQFGDLRAVEMRINSLAVRLRRLAGA